MFNYGKIGPFAKKCPYAKSSYSDEEEYPKKEKKYQNGNMKGKIKVFKKNLYSREDSSSFEEDNESDSDLERVFFMAMENKKNNKEGEVDFEAELINALTEMKKERKKNIYVETQLEEGK
jgi:hypothetical protein